MSKTRDAILRELDRQGIPQYKLSHLILKKKMSSWQRWLSGSTPSVSTQSLDIMMQHLGLEIIKKGKKP